MFPCPDKIVNSDRSCSYKIRIWNQEEVLMRLHNTSEWFRRKRVQLETRGFPHKSDILDGWDSKAIERWLDQMAGLNQSRNDDEDDCLRAIKGYES